MKRRILTLGICIGLIFSALFLPSISAEEGATLTIWIHEIEQVDDIDWFIDEADWSYKLQIYDEYNVYQDGTGWIECDENDDNPIPDNVHTFTVSSSIVKIYITLADREGGESYDIADISSRIGGGTYGWTSGSLPSGAQFKGTYNLITDSLSGDYTTEEQGYYKTSGDWDGSDGEGEDELDAHLWFDIDNDYSAPTASMTVSSTYVEVGMSANFDGSGSTASTGCTITKYEWDFEGDGFWDVVGLVPITSFTYNDIGTYTAKLRVTDTLGETDTYSSPDILVVSKVEAKFVYSPSSPTTFDTIQFTDTSEVTGGTFASWYWNFRDGTSSTERNPSHKYSEGGTYTVTLTVTTDDGQQDLHSETFTVIALANITGTVKDEDNNPINEATITLYIPGTLPAPLTTTTNTNGVYTISEIAAGTYDIEATKSGYDTNKKTYKTIYSGENTVDFVLTATSTPSESGEEGTPGFELIIAFLAMAIVSIILLKRRK